MKYKRKLEMGCTELLVSGCPFPGWKQKKTKPGKQTNKQKNQWTQTEEARFARSNLPGPHILWLGTACGFLKWSKARGAWEFLLFFFSCKVKVNLQVLCSCALELKSFSGKCRKESRVVGNAQTLGLAGFQPNRSCCAAASSTEGVEVGRASLTRVRSS